MPIHTDDLLEMVDRVLAQPWVPPAEHCGWCNAALTGREASLDFCRLTCQDNWHLSRTDGYLPEREKNSRQCPCEAHDECEAALWASMGLGRAYEAHVRFVEREQRVRSMSTDTLFTLLARWLNLDPDS